MHFLSPRHEWGSWRLTVGARAVKLTAPSRSSELLRKKKEGHLWDTSRRIHCCWSVHDAVPVEMPSWSWIPRPCSCPPNPASLTGRPGRPRSLVAVGRFARGREGKGIANGVGGCTTRTHTTPCSSPARPSSRSPPDTPLSLSLWAGKGGASQPAELIRARQDVARHDDANGCLTTGYGRQFTQNHVPSRVVDSVRDVTSSRKREKNKLNSRK